MVGRALVVRDHEDLFTRGRGDVVEGAVVVEVIGNSRSNTFPKPTHDIRFTVWVEFSKSSFLG